MPLAPLVDAVGYPLNLEASKGGMKVGRVNDPLYKDSYLGITPPTFTPPLEPFDKLHRRGILSQVRNFTSWIPGA